MTAPVESAIDKIMYRRFATAPPSSEEWAAARAELAALRARCEDLEIMVRALLSGRYVAGETVGGEEDGRVAFIPCDVREGQDPDSPEIDRAYLKARKLPLDERGIPILDDAMRLSLREGEERSGG